MHASADTCAGALRLLYENPIGRILECRECGRWHLEVGSLVVSRDVVWFLSLRDGVARRLDGLGRERGGPTGDTALGIAEGTMMVLDGSDLAELQALLAGASTRVHRPFHATAVEA